MKRKDCNTQSPSPAERLPPLGRIEAGLTMQCRLRARRSRASSMVFRPWPLRTEIVPDSLNLWMILCTVDDDNFKLFAIFLILLHYFSPQHWGNWWSSSHLDFWETLPLWEALFIPNHVANWPNKLQIGPPAVPYMYIELFRPLIASCPNFFGMCSSHEIQNEPIFGMTFQNVSLSTFDMLSIFYCE